MLEQNKILTEHFQSKSLAIHNAPRLLLVGPLPPPPDGPSVCFKVFCDEIEHSADLGEIQVIDSSPKRLKDEHTRKVSAANFAQAARVLWPFIRQVRRADRVLIFGSNGFLLTMAPLLLGLARKPCYLRAFGGSLDRFYAGLNPLFRQLLRFTLRHADGLIVETELLYNFFAPLIGDKVHLAPGYRPLQPMDLYQPEPAEENTEEMRLVFLGHVREEKGVSVLLESMKKLNPKVRASTHCDIYGPIYESFNTRFEQELSTTDNCTYKGVLDPADVISTLHNYDVFVFPTHYKGEGHPGVLVEAMMAGIPVITTDFRSIPELIEDGVNGLLVAPESVDSLVEAIETAYNDRSVLNGMGRRNWERRTAHDASQVVSLLLQPMGIMSIEPT